MVKGFGAAIAVNKLKKERDLLRAAAEDLWKLLDDISTLDDACREDDASFRKTAYEIAEKRNEYFGSDGYNLKFIYKGKNV